MLGLFAVLLLGFSLLAMFPLSKNLQADRYKLRFRVIVEEYESFCIDSEYGLDMPEKDKKYLTTTWVCMLSLQLTCSRIRWL
jgi:hypothetical protein